MKINRQIRTWLGAAALLALTACGGGGGPDAPAGGGTRPPAGPQARASIGAAGGEVGFADQRFKLTIPAGALGNTTEIVITELSAADVSANLQQRGAQKAYRLEPDGLQFTQPVTATVQLPASGNIAVLLHESDGAVEIPATQGMTLAKTGRTLTGEISHFSSIAFSDVGSILATITVTPRTLRVGEVVRGFVSIAKLASDRANLALSRFETTNLDAKIEDVPPSTSFLEGEEKSVNAFLSGTCMQQGKGSITYRGLLSRIGLQLGGNSGVAANVEAYSLEISDDFDCSAQDAGTIVATGVFDAGVSSPEDIRVFSGPFANLTTPGPFATVAGAEGATIIDLTVRRVVANLTTNGPERDVLGSPLVGVLPVRQAGANAPAALFGYATTGLSAVRTALRNYDPASGAFGFTSVGFTPTFDATTVGGSTITDGFVSAGPSGVQHYEIQAAGFQAKPNGTISSTRFPGGQPVSAFQPVVNGPVLVATRGHDNNTTSRVFVHPASGSAAATPIATLPAEARRIRCTNVRVNSYFCGVTLASGSTSMFIFDSNNATASVTPLNVQTELGTFPFALEVTRNGDIRVVVGNRDANSLNVIRVTPDLALISNARMPAPAGVLEIAGVGLVTDSQDTKAVVTGYGSRNVWIEALGH